MIFWDRRRLFFTGRKEVLEYICTFPFYRLVYPLLGYLKFTHYENKNSKLKFLGNKSESNLVKNLIYIDNIAPDDTSIVDDTFGFNTIYLGVSDVEIQSDESYIIKLSDYKLLDQYRRFNGKISYNVGVNSFIFKKFYCNGKLYEILDDIEIFFMASYSAIHALQVDYYFINGITNIKYDEEETVEGKIILSSYYDKRIGNYIKDLDRLIIDKYGADKLNYKLDNIDAEISKGITESSGYIDPYYIGYYENITRSAFNDIIYKFNEIKFNIPEECMWDWNEWRRDNGEDPMSGKYATDPFINSLFDGIKHVKKLKIVGNINIDIMYTFYGLPNIPVSGLNADGTINSKLYKGGSFNYCDSITTEDNTQIIGVSNSLIDTQNKKLLYSTPAKSIQNSIPSSVETIGVLSLAYRNYEGGKVSLTVPNNVKYIEEYSFIGDYNLNNLKINKNVIDIKYGAFWGCGIEYLYYNTSAIYYWGTSTYYKKMFGDSDVRQITNLTLLETYIGTNSLSTNGLYKVFDDAFLYCENLYKAVINDYITEIGNRAYCCTALRDLQISDEGVSVPTVFHPEVKEENSLIIGEKAFYSTKLPETFRLSNRVTQIKRQSFADIDTLKSITLGINLTKTSADNLEMQGNYESDTVKYVYYSNLKISYRTVHLTDDYALYEVTSNLTYNRFYVEVVKIADDDYRICYFMGETYSAQNSLYFKPAEVVDPTSNTIVCNISRKLSFEEAKYYATTQLCQITRLQPYATTSYYYYWKIGDRIYTCSNIFANNATFTYQTSANYTRVRENFTNWRDNWMRIFTSTNLRELYINSDIRDKFTVSGTSYDLIHKWKYESSFTSIFITTESAFWQSLYNQPADGLYKLVYNNLTGSCATTVEEGDFDASHFGNYSINRFASLRQVYLGGDETDDNNTRKYSCFKQIKTRAFYNVWLSKFDTGNSDYVIKISDTAFGGGIGSQNLDYGAAIADVYLNSRVTFSSNTDYYPHVKNVYINRNLSSVNAFIKHCQDTITIKKDCCTIPPKFLQENAYANSLIIYNESSDIKYIGYNAFTSVQNNTVYRIIQNQKNIFKIDEYAFYGTTLEDITMSANFIEKGAFENSTIRNIVINDVIRIEADAFKNCTNLETVVLNFANNNLLNKFGFLDEYYKPALRSTFAGIENSAFEGCTKLTQVVINGNIRFIGDKCFYNCTNLTDVDVHNSELQWIGSQVFENCIYMTEPCFGYTSVNSGVYNRFNNGKIVNVGKNVIYNTAYWNDQDNWKKVSELGEIFNYTDNGLPKNWMSDLTYNTGDKVIYQDMLYESLIDNNHYLPTQPDYWQYLNDVSKFKGTNEWFDPDNPGFVPDMVALAAATYIEQPAETSEYRWAFGGKYRATGSTSAAQYYDVGLWDYDDNGYGLTGSLATSFVYGNADYISVEVPLSDLMEMPNDPTAVLTCGDFYLTMTMADVSDIFPPDYDPYTDYVVGDRVVQHYKIYECVQDCFGYDHPPFRDDGTYWEEVGDFGVLVMGSNFWFPITPKAGGFTNLWSTGGDHHNYPSPNYGVYQTPATRAQYGQDKWLQVFHRPFYGWETNWFHWLRIVAKPPVDYEDAFSYALDIERYGGDWDEVAGRHEMGRRDIVFMNRPFGVGQYNHPIYYWSTLWEPNSTLYTYRCLVCNKAFEWYDNLRDKVTCPYCGNNDPSKFLLLRKDESKGLHWIRPKTRTMIFTLGPGEHSIAKSYSDGCVPNCSYHEPYKIHSTEYIGDENKNYSYDTIYYTQLLADSLANGNVKYIGHISYSEFNAINTSDYGINNGSYLIRTGIQDQPVDLTDYKLYSADPFTKNISELITNDEYIYETFFQTNGRKTNKVTAHYLKVLGPIFKNLSASSSVNIVFDISDGVEHINIVKPFKIKMPPNLKYAKDNHLHDDDIYLSIQSESWENYVNLPQSLIVQDCTMNFKSDVTVIIPDTVQIFYKMSDNNTIYTDRQSIRDIIYLTNATPNVDKIQWVNDIEYRKDSHNP